MTTEATLDAPAEYLTRAQMMALLDGANVNYTSRPMEFVIGDGRGAVRVIPQYNCGMWLYRRSTVAYLLEGAR